MIMATRINKYNINNQIHHTYDWKELELRGLECRIEWKEFNEIYKKQKNKRAVSS